MSDSNRVGYIVFWRDESLKGSATWPVANAFRDLDSAEVFRDKASRTDPKACIIPVELEDGYYVV